MSSAETVSAHLPREDFFVSGGEELVVQFHVLVLGHVEHWDGLIPEQLQTTDMDQSVLICRTRTRTIVVPICTTVTGVTVRTDEDPVDPLVAPWRDVRIESGLVLETELDELETRRLEQPLDDLRVDSTVRDRVG
jgi:hypothetical protein